jgi:hypothetical protein
MTMAPARSPPGYSCKETPTILSTVTAGNSNQKKLLESTSSVKKVAAFNLDENEQYRNKQVYEDQCYGLWYSAQDFKDFRSQTTKLTKALLKSADALSYERVITRTYVACCEADQKTEQMLSSFEYSTPKHLLQCVDTHMLGMDKWAVKAVGEHRTERRSVIRRAVLFVQEEAKGNCETIRAESEYISLASRLYARTMAVALAGDIEGRRASV